MTVCTCKKAYAIAAHAFYLSDIFCLQHNHQNQIYICMLLQIPRTYSSDFFKSFAMVSSVYPSCIQTSASSLSLSWYPSKRPSCRPWRRPSCHGQQFDFYFPVFIAHRNLFEISQNSSLAISNTVCKSCLQNSFRITSVFSLP